MKKTFDNSRRSFLLRAGALGAAGSVPFAMNLAGFGATAKAGGGYKALVCLFLNGGNDAFNMVLPTDAASMASYNATRNESPEPINLLPPGTAPDGSASAGSPARLGGVIPITPLNPQGRTFALHPTLVAASSMFASKKLAIVANLGPLITPTTKAQYSSGSVPIPPKLFSHNDQQSTWQAFATEGATRGWGGLMGDILASGNGAHSNFTAVSAAGNAVFLAGETVVPYQVGTSGPARIGGNGATTLFGSAKAFSDMQSIASNARVTRALERDTAAAFARSIAAETQLTSSLPAASSAPYGSSANPDTTLQYTSPISGNKVTSDLARQFQIIGRMISANQAMGVTRQVYFAQIGGFDTHDNENKTHAELYAKIDHGLTYFDALMTALGLSDSVTLFTMSDFGRTFTSNGDGTDHGWGSHHFVMGGAVKGGDIYGTFPQLGVTDGKGGWTSPDQIGNGSMLPTSSTDQYAATLGAWLGVGSSDLASICPNLANFNTKNLGFV